MLDHHNCNHDHAGPQDFNRAFAIGVTLNFFFVVAEVGYGLASNSLALIADGGHNMSDVLGLLLAWGASVLAGRSPTPRYTYGFKRGTILVSLISALLLYAATGAIIWEAIGRFHSPAELNGTTIMAVAAVGLIINTATALLFMSGRKHDLNIKGAFLHMAADALVSAGVVGAGFAITTTGWFWLDPAVSLVIGFVVLFAGWGLLRDSLHLTVDGVPAHINIEEVLRYFMGLPGVSCVHDLHIWALSTTDNVLSAHIVMPGGNGDEFLHNVAEHLRQAFHIGHTTIQVERDTGNYVCHLDKNGNVRCWQHLT
jgi:cobalt-zinc-cadmium efflux system protein